MLLSADEGVSLPQKYHRQTKNIVFGIHFCCFMSMCVRGLYK